MSNDCLEKLSIVCGALSGYDGAAGLDGTLQRSPTPKRGREAEGAGGDDDDNGGAPGPQSKRVAHESAQEGEKRGGAEAGAPRKQKRVPDERRKLSRQISAYLRFGVLTLPEGSNIKLNQKSKKSGLGANGEGTTSEYRGAFNTLLALVFGDSLAPWSHVTNWLYLHAGEREQMRPAGPLFRLE